MKNKKISAKKVIGTQRPLPFMGGAEVVLIKVGKRVKRVKKRFVEWDA
jgi:hypothetical protein